MTTFKPVLKKIGRLVTKRFIAVPEELSEAKVKKIHLKETMTVNISGVLFDANSDSINYMTAIGALASWQTAQLLLSKDIITQTEYDAVYKQEIPWKDAGNEVKIVMVEDILFSLHESMSGVRDIVT